MFSLTRDKCLRCDSCQRELNYYNGAYGYNRHLQSKWHFDSKRLQIIYELHDKYCDDKLAQTMKATYDAVLDNKKLLLKLLELRAEGKPVPHETM